MVSCCSLHISGLPLRLGCWSVRGIKAGRCSMVSKEKHLSLCPHVALRIANEFKIACAPMSPETVKTGPVAFAQYLLAPQGPDPTQSGPSLGERDITLFSIPRPHSAPGNLLAHLPPRPPVSPAAESCKLYFWGVRPLIRLARGKFAFPAGSAGTWTGY